MKRNFLRESTRSRGNPSCSVAAVEPEFPINIGYLARAMANYGMQRLYIVSAHRLKKEESIVAGTFASHGSNIIEDVKYVRSVSKLKERYQLLIGTTAIVGKRKSNITRKALSPEECAKEISTGKVTPDNMCFLFGRDTTGLTNQELEQCDYVISIRTGSEYNTLNISHAASLIFYIFSRHNLHVRENKKISTRRERERVIGLFEELAEISDFQKFKRGRLRETLNRLLNRSMPSLRELYLLMGLASKANGKIRSLKSNRPHTH